MDSVASYAKQMGLKVIHTYDQPFLHADREMAVSLTVNWDMKRNAIISQIRICLLASMPTCWLKRGLILGRTSISNSMAPGTKGL